MKLKIDSNEIGREVVCLTIVPGKMHYFLQLQYLGHTIVGSVRSDPITSDKILCLDWQYLKC